MRLIDADAFLKDILTAGIGKTIAELKGDKDEYYLDAYKKFENKRIKA